MKWGFEILLVVFLLIGWLVMRREGFDPKDPALIASIQAVAPPDANLSTYVSAVQDFHETVYKYSDLPITTQDIQYYMVQQNIKSTDTEPLKKVLSDRYLGKKRETMLPVEKPAGVTYPAEPISDIIKPETYETNDKDPVLPKSKPMFQRPSLDRGGANTDVAAYSWDIKNYTQDSVEGQMQGIALARVPKLANMREGFSPMAGAVATTNDVYGPRIPKTRGTMDDNILSPDDSSRMYPPLYGPGNPYGETNLYDKTGKGVDTSVGAAAALAAASSKGTATTGTGTGTGTSGTKGTSSSCSRPPGASSIGDLDVNKVTANDALAESMTGGCGGPLSTSCDPWVGMTIPKNMAKTEPVPFLGDFSKFFR
jgi:hypothetical protein